METVQGKLFFEEMATGSFVLLFLQETRWGILYPFPYLFVKSNPLLLEVAFPVQFARPAGGEKLHFNVAEGCLKFINTVLLRKFSPPVTALVPRWNIHFPYDMLS